MKKLLDDKALGGIRLRASLNRDGGGWIDCNRLLEHVDALEDLLAEQARRITRLQHDNGEALAAFDAAVEDANHLRGERGQRPRDPRHAVGDGVIDPAITADEEYSGVGVR